jgi:hypothetical protein
MQARDAELLVRIKRLEDMLTRELDVGPSASAIESLGGSLKPVLLAPVPTSGQLREARPAVTLDDPFPSFASNKPAAPGILIMSFGQV